MAFVNEKGPRLMIVPLELTEANELVARWHRHHQPVVGHKFSVGAVLRDDPGVFVGAAIVGRPVARMLDNGWTLEVTRCVTDGTKNACSALYGACRRAAFALGYQRLVTYTLKDESGASLAGAGWKSIGETKHKKGWDTPSRPRVQRNEGQKLIWEVKA